MPLKRIEELTPEQKAENHISAMMDSLALIDELVSNGSHSEDIHSTIQRNVDHLNLMLSREDIVDYTSPEVISKFEDVINLGEQFINS